MFGNKEPDIEKLMNKGKVKQLINALTYISPVKYNPYMKRSSSSDKYFERNAFENSIRIHDRAAEALARINAAEAIEPLIEYTRKAYTDIHSSKSYDSWLWKAYNSGRNALMAFRGDSTVQKFIAILMNPNTYPEAYIREMIVTTLGLCQDMRAVEPLTGIINNVQEEDSVRISAMEAVSSLGAKTAIGAFVGAYGSMQGRFTFTSKMRIIKAIIKMGNSEMLISIMADEEKNPETKISEDENIELRKAAAQGLGLLGWKPVSNEAGANYYILNGYWDACTAIGISAVKPLIFWLQKQKPDRKRDWLKKPENSEDYEQIVKTLGNIGDERAVAPLLDILKKVYRPLYNAEVDGEIYPSGYAEMNEQKKRFYALRAATADALYKLSENKGVKPDIREGIKEELGKL